VIEYIAKFLQLSRFGLYLIPTEEKKAKKFEMRSELLYSDHDELFRHSRFLQLVDRASIYKESLKENVTEYTDQKMRA
jgi:hypothetical protein